MTAPHFWHTLRLDDVFERLSTSRAGLTSEEAGRRLSSHGPNELVHADVVSPWTILIGQFKNTLIIILLIATIISVFLGQAAESIAILVIVLFAVVLGFVQEFRAERAIEALKKMAAPTAVVVRHGREIEIQTRELVSGDVVRLGAGDKVPADGRVIESIKLQ